MATSTSGPPYIRECSLESQGATDAATAIQPSPNAPLPQDDFEGPDSRVSKKREREVSLEPSTPKVGPINIEKETVESKETRTPKKNRVQLEVTVEEDDARSSSPSPPLSASPPHEIKVRQISQGVEDIRWQNSQIMEDKQSESAEQEPLEDRVVPSKNDANHDAEDLPSSFTEPVNDPSELTESVSTDGDDIPVASISTVEAPNDVNEPHPSLHDPEPNSSDKEKEKPMDLGSRHNRTEASGQEPLKRPRENTTEDDNPRETKRPSPPPEKKEDRPSTPPPTSSSPSKLGGFMAYASPKSPFASVLGGNIFSESNKQPIFGGTSPSPSATSLLPPFSEATPSASQASPNNPFTGTAAKRSGFEAFSGSASPFVSVARSKSPLSTITSPWNPNKSPTRRANSLNPNAFSSYVSGKAKSLSVPVPKRPRALSPDGDPNEETAMPPGDGDRQDDLDEDGEIREATFGEKLRSTGDDLEEGRSDEEQARPVLVEQETTTGEEEEETVRQVRGKLFSLSPDNQWKERGTGILKLNVRESDNGGARLIMRKDAVYSVILNVTLFRGMRCWLSPDPRYLRFSAIENGRTTHYNLRVATAKLAEDLLEDINNNIPL